MGYAGGSNPYAYVEGQVLSATDPSGLKADRDRQLEEMSIPIWLAELEQAQTTADGADGRLDALNTWADEAMMTIVYDQLYDQYVKLEKENASTASKQADPRIAKLFAGASPISRGDFEIIANSFQFLQPDASGFGAWVLARFETGAIVNNQNFVEDNRQGLADQFGLTIPTGQGFTGYTALDPRMIGSPQQLVWAVGHETLHLWDPFVGRPYDEIEGPMNEMEPGIVGFASPFR